MRRSLPALGLLALLPLAAQASDPPSHDVSLPTRVGQSVVVEWTGTVQPGAVGAGTNSCETGTPLEDGHLVNLSVPAGAYDRVAVAAAFHIEWETAGSDMILSVLRDGAAVGSSDGGAPEENVILNNPPAGEFNAVACAFAVTQPTPYRGKLTLTATAASGRGQLNPVAGSGNAAGSPPRFQNYAPDYPRQGFGMFGGEATLDVNVNTDSIFYIGFLETLRLKLDESTSPAGQLWELKSGTLNSKTTSDPILVGDPDTGRIFAQQLIVGEGNSLSEFTDDDGETWTPGGGGGIRSGADHQSLTVGPYPTEGPGASIPHPLYPNAVYYCSQDIALVFCSRSDDGGLTFGPGVAIYTLADCQGLHGHVKVAPDGTVYVPVAGCPSPIVDAASSQPAVAVSEDAGLTWEVRPVTTAPPGSGAHGADPSAGIARDNTLYLGYISNLDNHPRMAISRDRGLTWERDVDLGAISGITAGNFPPWSPATATGASMAFFGSTFTGEGAYDAENFNGDWHLYTATTYDGGQTYHVSNLTPGDPIQRGGLCGGAFCRNLLDFFDMVIDPQGRMLVAYEDGCVGGCPLGSPGTFSDQAVIARQSGGRRLLSAFDPVEPARPGAPRLAGYRTPDFVYLEWPAVDHGGSPVTEYKVYRGNSAGGETLLRSNGLKRQFVDTASGGSAGTLHYRVSAVNARGESPLGNTLALAVGDNAPTPGDACTLPGLKVAIDTTGEPEAAPLTRDVAEFYIAEPEDAPGMLAFTLKFAQTLPPNQGAPTARVFFDLPNGGRRVRLNVTGANAAATYGFLAQSPDSGIHNTYTEAGELDEGTGYGTDGTLTFVIARDKLGLRTTDTILQVFALTLPPGAGSNITTEEAGYVDYRLVGNDFCANGGVISPPDLDGGSAVVDRDEGRFGGALPLATLGGLLLAGLWRRRRLRPH